jgi:hypothetical protein
MWALCLVYNTAATSEISYCDVVRETATSTTATLDDVKAGDKVKIVANINDFVKIEIHDPTKVNYNLLLSSFDR